MYFCLCLCLCAGVFAAAKETSREGTGVEQELLDSQNSCCYRYCHLFKFFTRMKLLFSTYLADYSYSSQGSSK